MAWTGLARAPLTVQLRGRLRARGHDKYIKTTSVSIQRRDKNISFRVVFCYLQQFEILTSRGSVATCLKYGVCGFCRKFNTLLSGESILKID